MAFADGSFFLGNTDAVLRFPYTKGQQQITGTGKKIADLPGGGYNQHWTRNVVVAPDGQKLYVSVGSQSNVEEEPLPRASVQVMNLDGSNQQTFAFGLRNPIGLDFHPQTRELYAAVNERDKIGDDLVPDYFTRLQQGDFYGWPYTYLTASNLDPRQTQNGKSKRPDLAALTKTPDVLFQAHSAALGLQFYDGKTFPEKYHNGAFVAFRGSWNRDRATGYKIVFVPFNSGRPQGYYEDFLTGFLLDPVQPTTWGRPVGLLVLPDGSLLLTEEANNRIYRIQYQAP
jgi:glucose/arabinose dehydrogenase